MSEKKKPQTKPKIKLSEHLTEHQIKELMGMFDPVYEKRGGKIRQKR